MDADKVDDLIRYAIGVAGLQDAGARELGEIHILKFIYLADLAYAESNGGQTFTGTPWTFYKFGPWCQPVQARIRPMLTTCGAIERTFTSPKFEGEGTRWHLDQDTANAMVVEGEKTLPWAIQRTVKLAVKQFGDDTSALLHHVYSTKPMLKAAPNDVLEFEPIEARQEAALDLVPSLTERQKKQQSEKLKSIRSALRARLAAARPKLVPPDPPPSYDEVFEAGVRALDADAGDPVPAEAGELVFDPTVWKSRGRSDPGTP